jgi:hypothetical protein
MINEIVQDAEAHKAAATVVGMWIVRETPVFATWIKGTVWPALVAIYPYCRDNGGVRGIISNFIVGKPSIKQT